MIQLTEEQKKAFLKIKGSDKLMESFKGQKGSGFGDAKFWKKVAKGIHRSGKSVNKFLKNTKVISKGSKLAKYVVPVVATLTGQPELLASIAAIEKVGEKAGELGYGEGTGMSMLGTGEGSLTIASNGQYQNTFTPDISTPAQGFKGSVMADIPRVMYGSGLGSFGTISPVARTNL